MSPRTRIATLWTTVAVVLTLVAALLWRPVEVAWRCVRLHEEGERAEAVLVRKLEDGAFALRLPGEDAATCVVTPPAAAYASAEPGRTFPVVRIPGRPGECVLVSTLEASRALLWQLAGLLAALVLGIVALALWLHRSFTTPAAPERRMSVAGPVPCPVCGAAMAEGYVPLVAGVHWRAPDEPIGLPHALRGLPGTVGWKGRPRLHAFRCASCEILTLQYGKPRG